MKQLWVVCRVLLVFIVITGILYPGAVWVIGQTVFPQQVNGSFVQYNGEVVGSKLIGQSVNSEAFFHGRFSATAYGTTPAGATNFGPTNPSLQKSIHENRKMYGASAPDDMLTSSGSGLDPHISVEAAMVQKERVSNATHIPETILDKLIDQATYPPDFGLLGKRRVDVLNLNLRVLEYQQSHVTHSTQS